MSANNDPIEVTVDKRGNVIILIDRHNLSAAEVLDMAARAMLAAGYDKSQILQAALAYGGRYATNKSATETQKSANEPTPAVAIAPPEVATEPSKVTPVESPEPLLEKTSILPETPTSSKEAVSTESKDLPAVVDVVAAVEETPVVIAPAPEPEVVPVTAEKPEPVAATPPSADVIPPMVVAEAPAPAPVVPSTPPPVPAVAAAEVKSEPVAASPPPFEVPPLAKAPAIPLRMPAAPVSVMGTPASAAKPAKSKMDEILEADRKRIQALIAANTDTKTPEEPVSAAPENVPVASVIPPTAAAVTPKLVVTPVSVVNTPKPQEAEPIKEVAAKQEDWQGQKFDPATSTSMLIPPMPGMTNDDDQEYAPVADKPLSPPPLPRKPVSVVTPAMMARPITAEVAPTPPANVPAPPAGGPVSMMSRITGFVKLNTIAIPHYQAEAVESTISTPKPMTPSVLSPQPPPTPAAKR